ncbi:unnamed protein product [Adineta steineri]|uniref:RNA-dependent RNA polymerase n=1 Tax=Adineta steineri TaxID=433720 RepID=A0A814IJU4_9BILA|nr:unnamed protein product [Adineta steineri]CAF1044769.1 unnamed protein product [Adineta steineri]
MAHEISERHYDDWESTVYCSLKNVFTPSIGRIVGDNLRRILGITHISGDEMAQQTPSYDFTCTRRQANCIRDRLVEVTTKAYLHIWFSMQSDPFHYIYNRRSMLADDPTKVNVYPVQSHFGSMYTHSTFNIHSEEHPPFYDLCILKWKNEPETIRIMSKDKSKQIFLPIKWIQKPILINTKDRPCVVLMLKYSVKMKRKVSDNGQFRYERVCNMNDGGFEKIVSKSSDILLTFHDPSHTYAFLEELTKETDEYHDKFTINFVTLEKEFIKENKQLFVLPPSASHKQQYALKMLYSLGYLFQDKYGGQRHSEFIDYIKNDSFNDMCYYLKEKLEENHCYKVKRIFIDFEAYMKEKRKEEKPLNVKKPTYCFGCISITPLRILYQKMETSIGNRALRMPQLSGEDNFLLIHIREEDNKILKDFDESVTCRLKSKMLNGIKAMNKTYRLFGTSTSQLKEMSFWFLANSENKSIEELWRVLGDFSSIKNVANYVARIGLYFSTSNETDISFKYIENATSNENFLATMIDDVETDNKKYCFTDGIGKMSWGVAGLVAIKLGIPLQSRYDIPSAYQVRIAGCKGMLAIDPESKLDQYYIKVRPSMEKFKSQHWILEICEHSKPLELKFNNQVIMLLSDLGNRDAVFMSYQNEALGTLSQQNQNEQLRKLKYSCTKDDLLKNRIPLPLNEARNMFGVVDETGMLEYGQVFIQYKDLDSTNEYPYNVVEGEVLVAKMPCLHPGDFRKFTAINVPALKACIRDCIVFPKKGPRPHPNEMSGSDLDGDQYWVYWGNRLRITAMDEPLSYEPSAKKKVPNITNEIVIDHIIESFGAASQGIICDVHLAIADSHKDRTRSKECKDLAELFARAVDAPKTGEIIDLRKVYGLRTRYCRAYPQFMKKYDQPICDSNSILNKLFLVARHHLFSQRPSSLNSVQTSSSGLKSSIKGKAGTTTQDQEFQKWLSSHNTNETQSTLKNSSTKEKLSKSMDGNPSKIAETKSSSSLIEQSTVAPKKQTKKSTIKNDEEIERDTSETSSIKGKKISTDSEQSTATSAKPTRKPTSKKSDKTDSESSEIPSTKGKKSAVVSKEPLYNSSLSIDSDSSSVISKLSLTASAVSENNVNQNIIFNGMTTVTNRIQWEPSNNNCFTVDLDAKKSGDNNASDKLVQLLLDSAKTIFSSNSKFTFITSWGELFLKFIQSIDQTKPKNIKELTQLIKETNDVEFLFEESTVKTITKDRDPSSKSTSQYVLTCKCSDISSNDISLIFDDKKVLKKILFTSKCWTCAVRSGEKLIDNFYEIYSTYNEIDSKHESFSNYLKSLFIDPSKTDLLSGTSPRVSVDRQLLKSTVEIISFKRLVRCEFALLNQINSTRLQFKTLENLECIFYQVTHISTETGNGKIETRETLQFHATSIQIAKKHEQDLKQLVQLLKDYFS